MDSSYRLCSKNLQIDGSISPRGEVWTNFSNKESGSLSSSEYSRRAARRYSKEFSYFLSNAQGSVSELATEILIARRLGFVSENAYDLAKEELDSIGFMLLGLDRSVRRRSA